MGNVRQTGEVTRPIVVVNLPKLVSQVEMTTQLIHQCVAKNGHIYGDDENTAYIYLDSPAAPILQDLYRDLQSQHRQMITYATAMAVDNAKYNHIHANAAQAITTAEIYLQSAKLQSNSPPPNSAKLSPNRKRPSTNS